MYMRLLPVLILLSFLSIAQGAQGKTRYRIRKRTSISDGLVPADGVNPTGALKAFGGGSIAVMTQAMHTLSNMLDEVDVQRAAREKAAAAEAAKAKPSGPPVITGFDRDPNAGAESSSDAISSASTSSSSAGNGEKKGKEKKGTRATSSST